MTATKLALSLIPLALILALYAAYVKLAAWLLRRSQIGWLHSFVFALLLAVAGVALRLVSAYLGLTLPLIAGFALGLAIYLLLGGWYFRRRVRTAAGEPLGWQGALLLSALIWLLTGLTIVALLGLYLWLGPGLPR